MNYRDIAFKLFWTAAASVLPALILVLTDLETWWAGLALVASQAALSYVRQKVGQTPPVLEEVAA